MVEDTTLFKDFHWQQGYKDTYCPIFNKPNIKYIKSINFKNHDIQPFLYNLLLDITVIRQTIS